MARNDRQRRQLDYWPGFVDALASLVLVLVFVLLVFVIGQFYFSDALSRREAELDSTRSALSDQQDALGQARARLRMLEGELAALGAARAQLQSELKDAQAQLNASRSEIEQLIEAREALEALRAQLDGRVDELRGELALSADELRGERAIRERAESEVIALAASVQALRDELAELNALLARTRAEGESKDTQIARLSDELNAALASRVNELERYRSEFFGRLKEALTGRNDVEIVGDRFVLPTEVLFAPGSDALDEAGLLEIGRLAETLREVSSTIPAELDWVVQINGHTDRRPIASERFPSNWELSAARAIAIVKTLVDRGIPADRLSAAGYGEFQPLDMGADEAALARNRRIEIKLTNR